MGGQPPGWAFATTATAVLLIGSLVLPHWLAAHPGAYALEALPDGEREAMAWVAEHTPENGVFLVLSPKRSWEADYVLEWFPALAHRKSVLTVQGAEWLPAWTLARRACLYNELWARASDGLPSLESWLARLQVPYSHVYVSRLAPGETDLEPLRAAFLASPRYRLLTDAKGATVLVRHDDGASTTGLLGDPPIAPDCQTLFDQPADVQAAFLAVFGQQAPWGWMQEHDAELQQGKRGLRLLGTAFAAASR
jgi:hypothetical protein